LFPALIGKRLGRIGAGYNRVMINSLLVFAQDSVSIIRKVPVSEQVNSVIDNIASKLSVPATKLFEVLARQSFAEGVADLLTAGIFGLILIAGIKIALRNFRVGVADDWSDGSTGFWCGLGTVASIAVLIPLVIYTRNGVMEIMNPQYYAVRFILEALTPAPVR
jgi:hypothetical protein